MAQEQFNPLDQLSESVDSAGALISDALEAMHAQVHAVRGAQEPQIGVEVTSDNDKVVRGELPSLQIEASDSVKDGMKRPVENAEKVKEVLSRSERSLMSTLTAAVGRDNIEHIEEALEDISKHPDSTDRVMRTAAEEIRKNLPGISVSWEKGTSSDGKAFVRLKLDECGSKSGPFTHLTIGSDGSVHANHTPYMQYQKPPQLLTGQEAFRMLRSPGQGIPPANEFELKPKPYLNSPYKK